MKTPPKSLPTPENPDIDPIPTAAAVRIALTIAITRCTSAVKVTQSIMTSGGNSILLLRPVTFRNTHRVTSTNALSSWLAEPNSGQILA